MKKGYLVGDVFGIFGILSSIWWLDDTEFLPRRGICREVMGMNWETLSWKTVSDRSTVTPEK